MSEDPKSPSPRTRPDDEQSPWAVAGLGMQFFVALMMFVYVGTWLDRRFGTAPLFLLSGVLVGGGGVFFAGYRRLTVPRPLRDPDNNETSNRS